MARIVVSGYMIRHPLAGNVLAYFHYVLGLHLLGHDVVYVEESGWPRSCYDPPTRNYSDDPSAGLRVVGELVQRYRVPVPVWYVERDSGKVYGTHRPVVERVLQEADLLLDLGGVCWLPEFALSRRRAFVDMDPLFTQLGRFGTDAMDRSNVFFTYGANVGLPGCSIPTRNRTWHPTVPPVVPELWEDVGDTSISGDDGDEVASFTSIANWSAYGGIDYEGTHYGQKDIEFLKLIDVPQRTRQPLELALAGAGPEVTERLRARGWSVRNAGDVTTDIDTYRAYVARSRGEFSVAKHAYVATRSGWFSDRSVCYLAAGRPVVLQDTGFTDWLPVGCGVLPFSGADDAVEAISTANRHYARHARGARDLARAYFDYRVVLPALLDLAAS
jgi:hypothetical protein